MARSIPGVIKVMALVVRRHTFYFFQGTKHLPLFASEVKSTRNFCGHFFLKFAMNLTLVRTLDFPHLFKRFWFCQLLSQTDVRLQFTRAIKYSPPLWQHQSKELQSCQGCLSPALSWPGPTNLFEVLAPSVMACQQRRGSCMTSLAVNLGFLGELSGFTWWAKLSLSYL